MLQISQKNFSEYRERLIGTLKGWFECSLKSDPVNRKSVKGNLRKIHSELGWSNLQVVWLDSPYQAALAAFILHNIPLSRVLVANGSLKEISKIIRIQTLKAVAKSHPSLTNRVTNRFKKLRPGSETIAWTEYAEVEARQNWENICLTEPAIQNQYALHQQLEMDTFSYLWNATKLLTGKEAFSLREGIDQVSNQFYLNSAHRMVPYGNLVIGNTFIESIYGELFSKWVNHAEHSYVKNLKSIFQSVDYWWLFFGLGIVSGPPEFVKRDEQGRLHCTDGMAIRYPDGWGIYAWHGRRISKNLSTGSMEITLKDIRTERDMGLKMLLIERFGINRYIKENQFEISQKDDFGKLYKWDYNYNSPMGMLVVENKTIDQSGKYSKHILWVPPGISTAKEGVAWTFNMESDEYSPSLET